MFIVPLCIPILSVLFYGASCVWHLRLLDSCIVYELNFLLSDGSLITSHVICRMLSSLMSGIQSNAEPSPAMTKDVHLAILSFCIEFTVHMPTCSLSDLLYVF